MLARFERLISHGSSGPRRQNGPRQQPVPPDRPSAARGSYIDLHRRHARRLGPRVAPREEVHMCRWLAYSGSPVRVDELIVKPKHSLIDQSLHSTLGATTTNGDGFGLGWYGVGSEPGLFHSTEPAWNDRNLRDLARHLVSPMVFAHIRASTGGAIQQTNCHPFRYGNWLWMHNGLIREFRTVKRDLVMSVDPDLYPFIEGSTDSETFFYLALTLGLQDDPPRAMERTVGLIEQIGRAHGVADPIQMTVATGDGERLWAFRYSSEHDSRSLYFSTAVATLRAQYPNNPILWDVSDETRMVVSEPFGGLVGAWREVPESSWGVVQPGQDELWSFRPRPPAE
jgi:predicted glutamine amidotransferase